MTHNPRHGIGNGKDPMHQAGPNKQAELFKAVSALCSGFPTEDVLAVAANLLVNSVRQSAPTWNQAETAFNDRFGWAKNTLHECYGPDGKRRSVFPFHQIIQVPFVKMGPNGRG